MIDYDCTRGEEALRVFEQGQPPQTLHPEGGDGYIGELTHMLDSIRRSQPPSVVNAAEGASAVEICEAEEESIKTGQVVVLG